MSEDIIKEKVIEPLLEKAHEQHAAGDTETASLVYAAASMIANLYAEGEALRKYMFLILLLHNKKIELDAEFVERFAEHDCRVSASSSAEGKVTIEALADEVQPGNEGYPV